MSAKGGWRCASCSSSAAALPAPGAARVQQVRGRSCAHPGQNQSESRPSERSRRSTGCRLFAPAGAIRPQASAWRGLSCRAEQPASPCGHWLGNMSLHWPTLEVTSEDWQIQRCWDCLVKQHTATEDHLLNTSTLVSAELFAKLGTQQVGLQGHLLRKVRRCRHQQRPVGHVMHVS